MENYLTLLVLFVAGYCLRHVRAFPRDTANSLNLFVIYVSLPALILYKVPGLTINAGVIATLIIPWSILVLSALAVLALSRLLGWSRPVTGALLLVVPMGNTSFLGIPMVTSFFGSEGVPYAVLYDQFGSFLALATYGTYVLAAYGKGARPSLASVARRIVTFPPFIALALALGTGFMEYPPFVVASLKNISASLVPVVMVAIGFQLRLVIKRDSLTAFGAGLFIKLVAAPLMAIVICRILGMQGLAAEVSVFEAGMPPMVTAGALAIMGGLATELTAAMIGYGLVLSFLWLPVLSKLIGWAM